MKYFSSSFLSLSLIHNPFLCMNSHLSQQNWYSYQFTCLQVLEFLKTQEDTVGLLIKHLGTSAIMDLLQRLITGVEGNDMRKNVLTVIFFKFIPIGC